MKVIKTLKSLKFWSKKKKKRKINNNNHNSPPQGCYYHHHHHHNQYDNIHTIAAQPSAPPLPLWLDYEQQTYSQHLLASDEVYDNESPGLPISYQAQSNPEQDAKNNARHDPCVENPSASAAAESDGGEICETRCSYQQYIVENPIYGVPVLPSIKTERSGGAVGCVFNVGAHLFRCFFPCFRIRDV